MVIYTHTTHTHTRTYQLKSSQTNVNYSAAVCDMCFAFDHLTLSPSRGGQTHAWNRSHCQIKCRVLDCWSAYWICIITLWFFFLVTPDTHRYIRRAYMFTTINNNFAYIQILCFHHFDWISIRFRKLLELYTLDRFVSLFSPVWIVKHLSCAFGIYFWICFLLIFVVVFFLCWDED